MSVLSSISALKTKINTYIKANYQQLITGPVLNTILHDTVDTINKRIDDTNTAKLDKTAIGYDATGLNLLAGQTYKINGVDVVSIIINGGGPAGPFDASGGTVPTVGSGGGGSIVNGNFWRITVAGTITGLLPNATLSVGDIIVASKNNAALVTDFYMIPGDQELAQILSRLTTIETKLATIENGATADQTPSEIRDALETLTDNDRLAQTAIKNIQDAPYVNSTYPDLDTIKKGLDNANNNKVDQVQGKQLSTNDFTTAERNKLAGLSDHFRGTYTTENALKTAIPVGNIGDEALVDQGLGHNAQKYIWDEQEDWIQCGGSGASSFAELSGNPGDNAALNSALAGKVNTNGTDRLMTAVEGAKLANQSGTNTGDQDLSGLQVTTQKGQANGYASLGNDGIVPPNQLPASSNNQAQVDLLQNIIFLNMK